ncbi:hypothetical protein NDU88_000343 [Pleurodeles waltl]|uniref:Uncharacterized protein n=1 Tax=Pleurodeles waltl TaxID=8319 RepID=A0AAV7VX40_PLEWA|nr:hypothetical protein NDU88_000343 [Pleurodeles waltl]
MIEAMHSFMASAKALAGGGMDEQGACSRRTCAGQVWGQGESYPPKSQGLVTGQGTENQVGPASDTLPGANDKGTVVRPDPLQDTIPHVAYVSTTMNEDIDLGS